MARGPANGMGGGVRRGIRGGLGGMHTGGAGAVGTFEASVIELCDPERGTKSVVVRRLCESGSQCDFKRCDNNATIFVEIMGEHGADPLRWIALCHKHAEQLRYLLGVMVRLENEWPYVWPTV
jgi:hypothetical protein